MNSRERFLATVSHEQPDRVVIGLRFSPEVMRRVQVFLGMDESQVWEWVGQDLVTIRPRFRQPASERMYTDPTIEVTPEGHFLDIFRIPFRQMTNDFQTYLEPAGEPPLANLQSVEELEEFPWPTTWLWDFSVIESGLETNRDKATWARSRGVFEIAHMMRGMDNLLVDFLQQPTLACALLDRIEGYLYEFATRTLEMGKGRYAFYEFNDDVACQRGMMISPTLWRYPRERSSTTVTSNPRWQSS
jgi:uroporphyrinogen decarboxylase